MIKKILLLLLTCVLYANVTLAQVNTKPLEKSLLWEISGNGLGSPSYLFGTYHFAGKSFADSLQYIKKYFNSCHAAVGEFVIDPSSYSKLAPAMMLTDNTLDKIFAPAEYQLITDYVKQTLDMDMTTLNKLKPAALEVLIVSVTAPKTISATNPALDEYFQTEGKARKDTVIGLETIEEQIDILLNTPMEQQKRHLLADIKKKDEEKKEIALIYKLYQQQNLNELGKLLIGDEDYTPAEMDKLLKNRNLKWMTEIPDIIKQQPTFIAVGAAHLVGQYGLINQLRLKGYTVKPVFE